MAVTITSRVDSVWGNYRAVMLALNIGADADTYNTGYKNVLNGFVQGPDETAMGWTASGGTVTFQTGSAKSTCHAVFLCN